MKITTRILTAALALAIAIPAIAQTKRVDKRTIIVRDGKVIDLDDFRGKRPFLGVGLTDLSPELRDFFGTTRTQGVLISSVEDNSPADKAGLRAGDVITAIDGDEVDSPADLRANLRDKKSGDTVRIDIIRNKAKQTVVATVTEKEFTFDMVVPPNLRDLEGLPRRVEVFSSPEFRAHVESLQDCGELQSRIKELETRLKELEKKLQK